MDEKYQSNSRTYARAVQPSTESTYSSYGAFGRSAEPVQTGRNPNTESSGTNKLSVYEQEQHLQPGYAGDLEGQRPRSKESSSSIYREVERSDRSRYGDGKREPDIFTDCHRIPEQALIGEGYSPLHDALSISTISSAFPPPEAKVLQTAVHSQPKLPEIVPGSADQQKKTVEGKIEEKEKSNEKVSKTKVIEELSPVKREKIDEDDQQMQQKRKVIQFIEQIATIGTEGIRDEFAQCRNFIPNAITRNAHDQNLKRCRYPDVICIDQTRVVLKSDDDGSDFIHASRIPLGDKPNEIIITQLPLSNTVKHFWEMIWQENVQAVLLFLTLDEWKQHAENIQLIPGKGFTFN
uniref:Tyrosine-protein phosphatase domain-containing protein n=1 Tax=Elaeophora elaphi TaxID=1147741 RepID=A0A0R3RLK8_9BILA